MLVVGRVGRAMCHPEIGTACRCVRQGVVPQVERADGSISATETFAWNVRTVLVVWVFLGEDAIKLHEGQWAQTKAH